MVVGFSKTFHSSVTGEGNDQDDEIGALLRALRDKVNIAFLDFAPVEQGDLVHGSRANILASLRKRPLVLTCSLALDKVPRT